MKPDDFEQKISQQPLRRIPSEWREEILGTAQFAVPTRHSPLVTRHWFAALLWPNPKAWAGLAAAWILIFAINLSSRDEAPAAEAKRPTPPSAEVLLVLKQQQQLRSELVGVTEPNDADRAKTFLPRPRSERYKDLTVV